MHLILISNLTLFKSPTCKDIEVPLLPKSVTKFPNGSSKVTQSLPES